MGSNPTRCANRNAAFWPRARLKRSFLISAFQQKAQVQQRCSRKQGRISLFLGVTRWLAFNIPMLYILNCAYGMFGMASCFLGSCYEALAQLLRPSAAEGFHVGYFGYIGLFFFLYSSYYGASAASRTEGAGNIAATGSLPGSRPSPSARRGFAEPGCARSSICS